MERIGKRTLRVAVQENTKTESFGERIDSWATIETLYASVKYPSASQILNGDQEQMARTAVFTMRYHAEIGSSDTNMLPRYRLVYGGRTFDITSVVDVDGRKRFMEIIAVEKVLNT